LEHIVGQAGLRTISYERYLKNPATYDPRSDLTVGKYLDDTASPQKISNETIQTVGAIIFGVGVSVVALFNNGYITGLHNIGTQEVLVLLGIGLGIGSLKDFVDKLNFKSP
jgi:hypothetical protein